MSCNRCSTASTTPAAGAGAPEVEAGWAGNRDRPRRCTTCGAFLRADGGCTRCEQGPVGIIIQDHPELFVAWMNDEPVGKYPICYDFSQEQDSFYRKINALPGARQMGEQVLERCGTCHRFMGPGSHNCPAVDFDKITQDDAAVLTEAKLFQIYAGQRGLPDEVVPVVRIFDGDRPLACWQLSRRASLLWRDDAIRPQVERLFAGREQLRIERRIVVPADQAGVWNARIHGLRGRKTTREVAQTTPGNPLLRQEGGQVTITNGDRVVTVQTGELLLAAGGIVPRGEFSRKISEVIYEDEVLDDREIEDQCVYAAGAIGARLCRQCRMFRLPDAPCGCSPRIDLDQVRRQYVEGMSADHRKALEGSLKWVEKMALAGARVEKGKRQISVGGEKRLMMFPNLPVRFPPGQGSLQDTYKITPAERKYLEHLQRTIDAAYPPVGTVVEVVEDDLYKRSIHGVLAVSSRGGASSIICNGDRLAQISDESARAILAGQYDRIADEDRDSFRFVTHGRGIRED